MEAFLAHIPPDVHLAVRGFVDGLPGFLEHLGVKTAESIIVDAIKRRVLRAGEVGSERLIEEVGRLREAVESCQAEIEHLRETGRWKRERAESEAADPGFEEFVEDALRVGARGRTESKRRLAGRLIADRLQIGSGDAEEIDLRRALDVLPNLTEPQLLATAAIELVHTLANPGAPFADRDAAERWLRERYERAIAHFQESPPWTDSDYETLGSLGVIRVTVDQGGGRWSGEEADLVEGFLNSHGVWAHDQLTEDSGSQAAKLRYRERFPTIYALSSLARGRLFSNDEAGPVPWRVRI